MEKMSLLQKQRISKFTDYLVTDSSVPSGLRWVRQNGCIAPGSSAGTLHKNKKYYVIQFFGTKYKCTDVAFQHFSSVSNTDVIEQMNNIQET